MKNRIQVLHGVNLDTLGRRDPEQYGAQTLDDLVSEVAGFAHELGFAITFEQTNYEGQFCEFLHRAREMADGLIINPGAWTHYSYAIRDALEVAGVPAVEVHLSAVSQREEWRRQSVLSELCLATVEGKGVAGYRNALELLKAALA